MLSPPEQFLPGGQLVPQAGDHLLLVVQLLAQPDISIVINNDLRKTGTCKINTLVAAACCEK